MPAPLTGATCRFRFRSIGLAGLEGTRNGMRAWPAIVLIVLNASVARADQADPYFHAIYCKAVWGALTEEQKGSVGGSSAALAAIQKILDGYVGSGAKSPRA